MKCRHKENYEYYILSHETAERCLIDLGFGKEYCAETYHEDKRYGVINDDCIKYGFEGSMSGCLSFGTYVVIGDYIPHECEDIQLFSEEEFYEVYEVI